MKHRINYNIIKHLLTKFRKATKFIFFNGSAMMALTPPPPLLRHGLYPSPSLNGTAIKFKKKKLRPP